MTIEPLDDRVLVQRQPAKDKTEGGLFIPESAQDKPQLGTVVAVGPNVTSVTPLNTVLFGKYSGSDVTLDNVAYVIMREEEIMGKVK